MNELFQKIKRVNIDDNESIKNLIKTFMQGLLKNKDTQNPQGLQIIGDIIKRFPKYCIAYRADIENYLSLYVNFANKHLVIEAAKCEHSLQQIRPLCDKTATPKSNWRNQIALLCETAQTLVDKIFSNSVDIYRNGGYFQGTESTTAQNSPFAITLTEIDLVQYSNSTLLDSTNKHEILCTRLGNLFIFIQAMLVEVYPVAKPIKPQTVLDIVIRVLSVSCGKNTTGLNVSNIQIEALRTLDALIACLGSNLVPYNPLLFRLSMQVLRWSSEQSDDNSRKVRCVSYRTLSYWLTTLHSHIFDSRNEFKGKSLEEELILNIINDITPKKHVIELMKVGGPMRHLSKKAKRKLAKNSLKGSSLASYMPGEKIQTIRDEDNDETVMAALECLEVLLTVSGIFLRPKAHKVIQECVIREFYNIDEYSLQKSLLLCRCMETMRKCTPHNVPPPTQYCLAVYSKLINSRHREIAKVCSQALLDIRLHLHCSPTSLNFMAILEEEQTKQNDTERRFSRKNVEALESLLSTRITERNFDTVDDEPANKTQKLNKEAIDNISISSRSSVETIGSSDDENDLVIEVELNGHAASDKSVISENVECEKEMTVAMVETGDIHNMITQCPIDIDAIDGVVSKDSEEVSNTSQKIAQTVDVQLDVLDACNVQSSNDDDIPINCGQHMEDSHNKNDKINSNEEGEDVINVKDNDIDDKNEVVHDADTINIDDMMADFVDEVNENVLV